MNEDASGLHHEGSLKTAYICLSVYLSVYIYVRHRIYIYIYIQLYIYIYTQHLKEPTKLRVFGLPPAFLPRLSFRPLLLSGAVLKLCRQPGGETDGLCQQTTSSPPLPFLGIPSIPTIRDHTAQNGGTLEGLGRV